MGKHKKNSISIYVLDELKDTIYGGGISDIKVNEDYIMAKSKELYMNDAPCIIIRTKIVNRVYEMLREFISERVDKGDKKVFSIKEIPCEYRDALELRDGEYLSVEVY